MLRALERVQNACDGKFTACKPIGLLDDHEATVPSVTASYDLL